MKYVIYLLLVSNLISASYADFNICTEDSFKPFTDLSLKNCFKNQLVDEAKKGNKKQLCEDCKSEFEKKTDKKIPVLSTQERQNLFLKAALNEYKKVIADNLVNVVKLRTQRSTGSNFKDSIQQCRMKSKSEIADNCKNPIARNLILSSKELDDLGEQTRNELAKLIAEPKTFSNSNTLLKRNNKCDLNEQNTISLVASSLEDSISPEFIKGMKSLDKSTIKTEEELLAAMMDFTDNPEDLFKLIKAHPLLSLKFKSPSVAIDFFKSIPSPETNDGLIQNLYSKETGNQFDGQLSTSCKKSFDTLVNTICSDSFAKGDLNLDPFSNYNKLNDDDFAGSNSDLITSEKLFNQNEKLLQFCSSKQNAESLDLSKTCSTISASVSQEYKDSSYSQFRIDRYSNEIGNISDFLCQNKEEECRKNKSFICTVYNKFNLRKKLPSSTDARIASSSNREINTLLRSMIGEPANLDPMTRKILVDNGILPKPDGTLVTQPDVPERRPAEYASAIQKQQSSQAKSASALSPASSSNQAYNQTQGPTDDYRTSSDFNSSGSSSSSQTASSEALNNLRDQEKELQNVQNEIRRRLSQLPNSKPSTLAQAKQIAADSYQSQGMSYSPEDLNRTATEMMAATPHQQTVIGQSSFRPSGQDQSVTSGGETRAEKFKNEQGNRALMGMAGAQQSELNDNKNSPSQQADKSLTKVALHVSEDPKVNLSETLSRKLDPNDPETKMIKDLLKKQSNFLLQMKSVNFKVIFTENNKFNLVLESGDKVEAERIRPQLEIFLNKIKRNNTLHNLSQSWST